MTLVSLFRTQDGRLCGYSVDGHTGYAPSGCDIVCSALSFLSITCANALESVARTKPHVQIDEENGKLRVALDEGQMTREIDIIMQVYRQGLDDLKAAYPNYVEITDSLLE